jgi:serine/threonine-protein kinase
MTEHHSVPRLPRSLGAYRLLRRIGSGGMAEVYLALAYGASGFEKKVAIKAMLPEMRDNATLQRILIEEAKLGARLQHRNLVQVHDLGVAEGTYFLRMDYVDGADLRTLLHLERPERGLALLIAEEVVLAMEYLHQARDDDGRPLGLVHRDVSPGNVLLSRAGEVKLSDFGITKATMLADVTQANVLKGKYAYMSPEQVSGRSLTAQSDQFGLGIMLAEMLSGRRPYDGETPLATMELIRAAAPPDLAELDPDLRPLILRCLAADPGRRFESDDALRAAISTCRGLRPAVHGDLARWVAAHC